MKPFHFLFFMEKNVSKPKLLMMSTLVMMCTGVVSSGVMVMLPYFNRIISHYYPSTQYLLFPHPIFSIPRGPAVESKHAKQYHFLTIF